MLLCLCSNTDYAWFHFLSLLIFPCLFHSYFQYRKDYHYCCYFLFLFQIQKKITRNGSLLKLQHVRNLLQTWRNTGSNIFLYCFFVFVLTPIVENVSWTYCFAASSFWISSRPYISRKKWGSNVARVTQQATFDLIYYRTNFVRTLLK